MKISAILFSLLFGLVLQVSAQQDAHYSMYMFNGQYINPAYTGSKEVMSLTGLYRHQWAGFDGAPRSVSAGIHAPLRKDQYALGLLVNHDRLGVTKMNSLHMAYAYRIKMQEGRMKLSLGIQGGFTHYQSDLNSIDLSDATDAAFAVNQALWMPNFGFGVYWYSNRFYVGAAVPHMLNNSLNEKLSLSSTNQNIARQYKHWIFTGGYVFGKEHAKIKFKPSILIKHVKNTPIDFDFNASVLIVDRIWLGASYRTGGDRENDGLGTGESLIGMLEFMVTKQLRIGYAYDYSLSNLQAVNNGSHEIMLGFDFWREHDRFVNPRYIKYF